MTEQIGVVVSRGDGKVVAQSEAASAWLGPAGGRACWALLERVPGARRLPCSEGCVADRIEGGTAVGACSVALRGQRFDLECVPVDGHVVSVLRSRPGPAPEPWERLTPREVAVLHLMADGLTTAAIAKELGIQPGTVRAHVEHMRGRLGCRTRAAIVAQGFRLKYLT